MEVSVGVQLAEAMEDWAWTTVLVKEINAPTNDGVEVLILSM